MRAIVGWMTAYAAWLCGLFRVTPDGLVKGRRGNLPPPDGGIASF